MKKEHGDSAQASYEKPPTDKSGYLRKLKVVKDTPPTEKFIGILAISSVVSERNQALNVRKFSGDAMFFKLGYIFQVGRWSNWRIYKKYVADTMDSAYYDSNILQVAIIPKLYHVSSLVADSNEERYTFLYGRGQYATVRLIWRVSEDKWKRLVHWESYYIRSSPTASDTFYDGCLVDLRLSVGWVREVIFTILHTWVHYQSSSKPISLRTWF